MVIKEKNGVCTGCGQKLAFKFGQEDFDLNVLDLENYKKYKDIYVCECPFCGLISTDLSKNLGFLVAINSPEYQAAYTYAYLKGLNETLYENHSEGVPANLYECFAIYCKQTNPEMYVRALNKTIELKLIMARKYRRSQDELGGEEENDAEYDELDTLIKESVKQNVKELLSAFTQIADANVFLKLIAIENLARGKKVEQASTFFKRVQTEHELNADLVEFFNHMLRGN